MTSLTWRRRSGRSYNYAERANIKHGLSLFRCASTYDFMKCITDIILMVYCPCRVILAMILIIVCAVNYHSIFLSGWSATSRELTSSTRASCKRISTTNCLLEEINWQSQLERCFIPVTPENKDISNGLLWLLTSHTLVSWAKLTTCAGNVHGVWSVVTLYVAAAAADVVSVITWSTGGIT